jgi:hypothetical protein
MVKETFKVLKTCLMDGVRDGKPARVEYQPGATVERDPSEALVKALVHFGQLEQITGVKEKSVQPQTPKLPVQPTPTPATPLAPTQNPTPGQPKKGEDQRNK